MNLHDTIIAESARAFNCSQVSILAGRRTERHVLGRHLACVLLTDMASLSSGEAANALNMSSHSAVLNGRDMWRFRRDRGDRWPCISGPTLADLERWTRQRVSEAICVEMRGMAGVVR